MSLNYIFYCGDYKTERTFKEGTDEKQIDAEFDVWVANYEYENKIDDIDGLIIIGGAGYYEV